MQEENQQPGSAAWIQDWQGLWHALGSPVVLDLTGGRKRMLAGTAGSDFAIEPLEGIGLLLIAGNSRLHAHPELAARLSANGVVVSLSGPFPDAGLLKIWGLGWTLPLASGEGAWIAGRDDRQRAAVAAWLMAATDAPGPALVQAYERLLEDARQAEREAIARTDRAEARLSESEARVESLEVKLVKAKYLAQPTWRRNQQLEQELRHLIGSKSWRLTGPLRRISASLDRARAKIRRVGVLARSFANETRTNGFAASFRRTRSFLGQSRAGAIVLRAMRSGGGDVSTDQSGSAPRRPNGLPPAAPASQRLVQRVLIVAELGLPQCLKYRVLQKRALIQSLGVECTVINWSDVASARSLLQTHTIAIFYRVPGWPDQLETVRIAKSLGVVTIWEVDDLIFDLEAYLSNTNLDDLDESTREGLLNGVPVYQRMMLACDECIASTPALASAMRKVGVRHTHVIRNALDGETIGIAERIRSAPRRRRGGPLRIVYGSGSRSHDSDFREAAEGLLRVLKARFDVRLVVIGMLNLPDGFDEVERQIDRVPFTDYETYLGMLAECEISIAPLEQSVFNDAKSNIKYLEASAVGLPTVCSPSEEFRLTVEDGRNGFLAATADDWERQLLMLIGDRRLRESVGAAARQHVMLHFTPEAIAVDSVKPFLSSHRGIEPSGLRVLGVNIFFEPRSFGGATIVAEQVAKRVNEAGGATYAMLTSTPTDEVHPYKVIRYEASQCEVFAMGLPPESNPVLDYDNPFPLEEFRQILRSWQPGVVHLHSIQGFGVQLAEACEQYGIPFVVTLHDAWWLCARQFMVTGTGRFCGQKDISLAVCARCVAEPSQLPHRDSRLRDVLSKAALLLAPSEYSRELYVANGFDPEKVVVNKNGISMPRQGVTRSPPGGRKLRFGFVGGEGVMKGGDLIKKAFRSLPHANYELLVVDNALNLGWRSIHAEQWVVPGETRVVPAYTQETIDEFFGMIDVLLCPSQCKESFGLAAREALVRDVWLISTDAGGVVEDIIHGVNGSIVPFDDDGTELARRIAELLEDPAKLDEYVNPASGSIQLFEQQARELREHLERVAISQGGPRRQTNVSEVEFYENLMRQM